MTKRSRILLIEGDESLRQLLGMALRLEGFDVDTAADADEIRGHLEGSKPDLVLSCMTLPTMDAFALLNWLRRERRSDVPVMILTRRAVTGIRDELLQAGANDVAFKPIKIPDLVTRLRAL